MSALATVRVEARDPGRFRDLLGGGFAAVEEAIRRVPELLAGRVVWHVNSTAEGGGVVEILHSLLGYARGAGVDSRWLVVEGDAEFFRITKRIHNRLHGAAGDGGPLGAGEREIYDAALAPAGEELASMVAPGDVVYLHDPQTAGLAPAAVAAGARVVWRCHVGIDEPNDLARGAWSFLLDHVRTAHACVFSRREYAWDGLERSGTWIIPPSIDAFAPKNQDLDPGAGAAILGTIGLLAPGASPRGAAPAFVRDDGSPGLVGSPAAIWQEAPVPAGAPYVTQVSRWDRLKDPIGVMQGFATAGLDGVHLVLGGPEVAAVADDPEGGEVLGEVRAAAERLPAGVRRRVHLACLPMRDRDENAAMVNAIQREATVVVQKSIAEGFGLTVAEAMWKSRPVVASAVGGIRDQIVDGESGLLVGDPRDLEAYAACLTRLVADAPLRDRLGAAARRRVIERFLGMRHLLQNLELVAAVVSPRERRV